MEKYKENDEVICNGNVGNLWFNEVKGKIIRRNKFTDNYLIKFTGYQLELHEEQIELINRSFVVVLIPMKSLKDLKYVILFDYFLMINIINNKKP